MFENWHAPAAKWIRTRRHVAAVHRRFHGGHERRGLNNLSSGGTSPPGRAASILAPTGIGLSQVLMPLDKYPFSERYGWLEDRYGLSWQVIMLAARPSFRNSLPYSCSWETCAARPKKRIGVQKRAQCCEDRGHEGGRCCALREG